MKRKTLFLWALTGSIAWADAKISVPSGKGATLAFTEKIEEVVVGTPHYFSQIKGRYLLLRAKRKTAPNTSLCVIYGPKQHCFVAELSVNEKAPLLQEIPAPDATFTTKNNPKTPPEGSNATAFFSPGQAADYQTIGANRFGISVMLTNIIQAKKATYLRLFVNNRSSIDLNVTDVSFDYFTYLRTFWFFKQRKSKLTEPLQRPSTMEVPAHSSAYFVFALPPCASDGGLKISLGETGERHFTFEVPSGVLQNAKR